MKSVCGNNQSVKIDGTRRRSFAQVFALIGVLLLTACNIELPKTEIVVEKSASASASTSITSVSPSKPVEGNTVTLTGKGFISAANIKAGVVVSDSSTIKADLKVASSTSASFVMPAPGGLSLTKIQILRGQTVLATYSVTTSTETKDSTTETASQLSVATPTFSAPGGLFTSSQNVSISSDTAGASIYYTTDGSSPTIADSLYTAPISVAATMTIKAIAVMANYSNSAIVSATYTKLETITAGTSGTTGFDWDLMCSSDSVFIGIQVNTANATYSSDGVNWTKITLPVSANWQQVVWNGSVFLLVSRQTTVGLVSNDGISWTQIVIPSADWRGIAALGSKILLMPTQNNTTAQLTTDNGVTWVTSTIPAPGMWGMYPSIISDGTRFIAINFANNTSSFISSTDGLSWTETTMNYTFPGQLYKLGWNGYNYLALISGKLVISADAINWTEIASPLTLGSVYRNNIFSFGRTFVVFAAGPYGDNPKVAISDSSNTTWTNYTLTNQSWPMWVLKGGIVSSINSTNIGIWNFD